MTYHGEYDGFGSLATEQYDVLLYTTAWDGLPNVLLGRDEELAWSASPPDVGASRQLISPKRLLSVSGSEAVGEYAKSSVS